MPSLDARLATLEAKFEAWEKQMNSHGVWLRWIVTSLIGAAAAFGAVLAAEIARH